MRICNFIKKAVNSVKDNRPDTDYLVFLIPIFAEIICEDVTDKVRELHFSAYRKLAASLN